MIDLKSISLIIINYDLFFLQILLIAQFNFSLSPGPHYQGRVGKHTWQMLQSSLFNSSNGYLDGLFRINKSRIITKERFKSATECNSLDDLRLFLTTHSCEYGKTLENVAKLSPSIIYSKCMNVLNGELDYILLQSNDKQIIQLINYFRIPFMIDNASLLLRFSIQHERVEFGGNDQTPIEEDNNNNNGNTNEILDKCHPLGLFDSLCILKGPQTVFREVYFEILQESPLHQYLVDVDQRVMIEELESVKDIEIFTNILYRYYLDDFFNYCSNNLTGYSQIQMLQYVRLESDLRILNISLNSLNCQRISSEDKMKMYCQCSSSFSQSQLSLLSKASSVEQIKQVVLQDCPPYYSELFATESIGPNIDNWFIGKELQVLEQVFIDSFTPSIFFSYLKLKEQEIRNIYWIAECIEQNQSKEMYQKHIL